MYFQCSLFIWAPEKYCEVFFYQARSIVFEGGGGQTHPKNLDNKKKFIYLILILIFYIVPKRGGQTPCCDKK